MKTWDEYKDYVTGLSWTFHLLGVKLTISK